ncbi:MAG: type II secretion system protein GspG [Spirochaetes bacterium]|nr:MAG: type II secretion system protein GspG [Spirochaetota bacterium]
MIKTKKNIVVKFLLELFDTGIRVRGKFRNRFSGFTLIELMVVIVILGILAGFIIPRITKRPEEARVTKAKVEISTLEQALELYYLDNGMYPTTEQGLRALIEKPQIDPIPPNWKEGGYLAKKKIPVDPWGRPYVYISPGIHNEDYDLYSLGRDGKEGGEGYDADITNWE